MQVVYSAGSPSTPSPRVQRKLQPGGYGRPNFTGHSVCKTSALAITKKESKDRADTSRTETSLRDSIPAMRKPVAITCLVLNLLLPGLGTFVAGLTTFCGSVIRFKTMTKQKVICSNTWVAFLQFATTFLFLLGWIWSIVWGVAFITISNDYFKNFKRQSIPSKHPLLTESFDRGNNYNCSTSSGVNRTGSSPALASHSLFQLQKACILRSSSADQPSHPLIVLEDVSNISQSDTSLVSRHKYPGTKTDRHRGHGSQCLDDDNSPNLEQIVIHNLPKAPVRRGVLCREDTVTSTVSSVSEHEQI